MDKNRDDLDSFDEPLDILELFDFIDSGTVNHQID